MNNFSSLRGEIMRPDFPIGTNLFHSTQNITRLNFIITNEIDIKLFEVIKAF